MATGVSRRDFLALAGTGPVRLLRHRPDGGLPGAGAAAGPAQGYPTDFNAYLRIGADGRVTCFVGKVELGQGSMTALAQLLAEELDVRSTRWTWSWAIPTSARGTWARSARLASGSSGRCCAGRRRGPGRAVADGRRAPPAPGRTLAREGRRGHGPRDERKRVTYAKLVEGKRIERHLEKVPVKPVSAFTVVGKSPRRKDALEKVTGKAKYAGDMTLPGMLHARILRPPAHGATLERGRHLRRRERLGAMVVRDGDLIAVLHERRDLADRALGPGQGAVRAARPGRGRPDHLRPPAQDRAAAPRGGRERQPGGRGKARHRRRRGDLPEQLRGARAHGNPLRDRRDRGRQGTVWASTQTPFSVKQQVAQALGFPPRKTCASSRPTWAAASAAKARPGRPWKRRGWRRSPASRCRWSGTAPRSSSTIPSARRRW